MPYGLTMGLIIGVSAAVVVALEPQHSPSMKMHARSLDSAPAGASTVQDVGRLFFPFARKGVIAHADTGYKPSVPTRVWAITRLDIAGREPLALRFDVYSVWPFEMRIDGKTLLAEKNPYDLSANQEDPGGALEKSVEITLDPGRHTLEMAFDFIELDGGFAVNYSYEDASGWRHRNMVGVSDERVRFTLPKEGGQP